MRGTAGERRAPGGLSNPSLTQRRLENYVLNPLRPLKPDEQGWSSSCFPFLGPTIEA